MLILWTRSLLCWSIFWVCNWKHFFRTWEKCGWRVGLWRKSEKRYDVIRRTYFYMSIVHFSGMVFSSVTPTLPRWQLLVGDLSPSEWIALFYPGEAQGLCQWVMILVVLSEGLRVRGNLAIWPHSQDMSHLPRGSGVASLMWDGSKWWD